MDRFKKLKLAIVEQDSPTVQALKMECNLLIEAFNLLTDPLSEQGQELTTQISTLLMKINQLKDIHFEHPR